MFNALPSNANRELFEKEPVIKLATMKNMDDFSYEGKPLLKTAKSTLLLSAKMNKTQQKALVSL